MTEHYIPVVAGPGGGGGGGKGECDLDPDCDESSSNIRAGGYVPVGIEPTSHGCGGCCC